LGFAEFSAKCRIGFRPLLSNNYPMSADQYVGARVSSEVKTALRAAAERQHLSESALVKRMIELMLHAAAPPDVTAVTSKPRPARMTRLYVRLTADDWAVLRERAAARCVAPATYASTLIGAHVRGVAQPLPKRELDALRQSTGQLRAIGNNLNQIAKASHQTGHVGGPLRENLYAVIKVCEGLRDHIRELRNTNAMSWQSSNGRH
jgi:hypothetical protein